MRSVLAVIFLQFLAILAKSHDYCRRCPGTTPQLDPDPTCYCGDLYYDQSTSTCVPHSECSSPTPSPDASDSLPSFDDFISILSSISSNAAHGESEKVSDDVAKLVSTLPFTSWLEAKEVELVRSALRMNIEKSVYRNLQKLTTIFNPYVMSSRKLLKECHHDKFCMMATVWGKHDKQATKLIVELVPEGIDGMIQTLEDVAVAEEEQCDVSECDFLKSLIAQKASVAEFLTELKVYDYIIADGIMRMLVVMREANDKVLKKNELAKKKNEVVEEDD